MAGRVMVDKPTEAAYKGTNELREVLHDSVRPDIRKRVAGMSQREVREFAIVQVANDIMTNRRILPEELTKRFDEVQLNLTKLDNGLLADLHKGINQIAKQFQKEIEPLRITKIQRGATKDIDKEIAKIEANYRDTRISLLGPLLNTEEYLKPREFNILIWG
jgi:hypothetical protein